MTDEPRRLMLEFGVSSYWHLYLGPSLDINWQSADPGRPPRSRVFMNGSVPCSACGGLLPHLAYRVRDAGTDIEVGVMCWSPVPVGGMAEMAIDLDLRGFFRPAEQAQ